MTYFSNRLLPHCFTDLPDLTHVVLGVTVRDRQVLVAWRDKTDHQSNCWEFPGGKVESGESPEQALRRELIEELGVVAEVGMPIINFTYDYGDRILLLDAREAHITDDSVISCQNRLIEWRQIETLSTDEFPPANRAILNALKLPHFYAITPTISLRDTQSACIALEHRLKHLYMNGVRLILFRAKDSTNEDYLRCAEYLAGLAQEKGIYLLLHDQLEAVGHLGATGVHLSQCGFERWIKMKEKSSIPRDCWVAVSCHSLEEVRRAEAANADFCVVGPVKETPGHTSSLEGSTFENIVAQANIPVYALGGMCHEDLSQVRQCGAQGIAGIRCFDL